MASILTRSSNEGARQIAQHAGRTAIDDTLARVGLPVPSALPLERMALGDGLLVTPLQVAEAWSHLAGRGRIDASVAATTRELLLGVVGEGGTGRKAAIDGVAVAGKTGTAPLLGADGNVVPDKYLASFVGIVPADDPEVVILVTVAGPQGETFWGGEVAAPAFRRIAESR